MKILALVTEAFGGVSGIAHYNSDSMPDALLGFKSNKAISRRKIRNALNESHPMKSAERLRQWIGLLGMNAQVNSLFCNCSTRYKAT